MAKTGRPRAEINKTEFKKLCALQCTLIEIANWFECSEDTIERWCKREYGATFAVVFNKNAAGGKISLRRNQFALAKRSASMAIWLGKQYLEQHDKQEVEHSGEINNQMANLSVEDLREIARQGREAREEQKE